MRTLDTPPSTSLPLHSTPRLNELLHLIRQRRNGTYRGPSDIITPLDPNEYSAFKTTLKSENLLSESDKLRWYWVQSTHQLHIRMVKSYLYGTFSGQVINIIRDAVTTCVQQLRPDSWANNAFNRLTFNQGGDFGPEGNAFDASLGYTSKDDKEYWDFFVEVAVSQSWNDVVSKAKDYFTKIPRISTLVIFKISGSSGTTGCEGVYQIWKRASRRDSRAVSSPKCTFLENGADEENRKGALRLRLRDVCPDMPDGEEDVEVDIPHDRLVEALKASDKGWHRRKGDKREGDKSAEDKPEEDERCIERRKRQREDEPKEDKRRIEQLKLECEELERRIEELKRKREEIERRKGDEHDP